MILTVIVGVVLIVSIGLILYNAARIDKRNKDDLHEFEALRHPKKKSSRK